MNKTLSNKKSSAQDSHVQDLIDLIDDLELNLDLNKNLIPEIISSKKANSQQHSEESHMSMFITSKSFDIIQQENIRLQESLIRMNCDIEHASMLISISEERAAQSRIRRKDLIAKHKSEFKSLKSSLQNKEEETRELTKYFSSLEDLHSQCLKQEALCPSDIVSEGKKLVSKINKQLLKAEIQRNFEENLCREAELELKNVQSNLKFSCPAPGKTTELVLKKDFLLNLNFESFWLVGSAGLDEFSDSIRSSDSSVQDVQFPDKLEFMSKSKVKVPKLRIPGSPEKDKKETSEIKLSRLELAYQIKCEEIYSLQRLLNDLQGIHSTLHKSMDENHE